MNQLTSQLLEKLGAIERDVAAEKGLFRFFALFLREDSPGKWDLLVSAPWLDANQQEGMDYLAKQVQSRLNTEELLSLSRLVFIGEDNPGLEAILRGMNVQHGDRIEVRDCNFFGLEIKHAYIITSDNTQTSDHRAPMPT
jgi:hypothetical protein